MSALGAFVRTVSLWPDPATLKTEIGCWGGLGRVIHWVGAALALNILVIGLYGILFDPKIEAGQTVAFCGITALVLYLPARGLRRLMAGE